jgi:nucleoid DNA-binding protein
VVHLGSAARWCLETADFADLFGPSGCIFAGNYSNLSPIRDADGRTTCASQFPVNSVLDSTLQGGWQTMAKKASSPKAAGKSEVFANISTTTGLSKKDVAAVFDALTAEIGKALGKKGNGVFQIPGLAKIILVRKPAQPAKKGVPNPFKPGELMDVAAKPAKNVVKVRPLKGLKGMV